MLFVVLISSKNNIIFSFFLKDILNESPINFNLSKSLSSFESSKFNKSFLTKNLYISSYFKPAYIF